VLQPGSTGKTLVKDVTDTLTPCSTHLLQQPDFLRALVAGSLAAILLDRPHRGARRHAILWLVAAEERRQRETGGQTPYKPSTHRFSSQ
jgi:hypothetical protein